MTNPGWHATLQQLKNGNNRFCNNKSEGRLLDRTYLPELASGQNPDAVILTCADSRIVPELIFDTGPGTLFVVRVAGNIANPSSVASIEFAVATLGVRLIVVMAHESCGAVTAAMQDKDAGKNLNYLLSFIRPVLAQTEDRDIDSAARLNCRHSAAELVKNSGIIGQAIKSGETGIVTAFYRLASGRVEFDSD
jgi:carbonic anhydrase